MAIKMPPIEKVYEAWSAISSGRIVIQGTAEAGEAEVASSNGAKTYHVKWEGDVFSSNDSASYWQGYPGYPVLALLMSLGKLPLCAFCAEAVAGVDWHEVNARAKRDYALALREVLDKLGLSEEMRLDMRNEALKVMVALEDLDIKLVSREATIVEHNKK